MKPSKKLVISALTVLILVMPAFSVEAAQPKRKRQASARAAAVSSADSELLERLRRIQETAEQAQAEARRTREENEALQRQIEQAAGQLALIRQELERLRGADCTAQLSELRAEVHKLQTALNGAPVELPPAEERLAALEDQVQINTAQIKEQAQTKVESEMRFRVRLFGMILTNAYLNTNDSSQQSAPQAAPPPTALPSVRQHNFGATLRQSVIGLALDGPRLGSARLSAKAEFDFFGGPLREYESNVLGALRMRTASVRLDWPHTSFVVGLQTPLISPLNPTSLAAVWYPALSGAGNLWQWRPQLMLEHRARLSEPAELILQGGLLLPFGETVESTPIEKEPGYEVRVALRRRLDSERHLEFGFGGHASRRWFLFNRRVPSFAVTGDFLLPLGNRVELSGEAFFGQGVTFGGLSGGRVDRSFALSGQIYDPATRIRAIHTAGGWAQLSLKARQDLDFNFAYGQEDPRNRNILAGTWNQATRFKNQAASANFIYQLRPNYLISLEYLHLWTHYAAARQTNGHLNLAFGYVF